MLKLNSNLKNSKFVRCPEVKWNLSFDTFFHGISKSFCWLLAHITIIEFLGVKVAFSVSWFLFQSDFVRQTLASTSGLLVSGQTGPCTWTSFPCFWLLGF